MNPKQIEEFFHLTPVEKHLLYQSEKAHHATHLAQFSCQLNGPLDVPAFERAWQKVVNHQPRLRLAFASGDLKEPVQFVNRNVGVALEKHDWRNLSDADQERRWADLLQADRQQEIILKTPPLWHMTLIRLDEERHAFLWTYHELLFDEHSLPLLFNEALQCYAAILQSQKLTLPLPVALRKYVDWVKKKDALATEHFWRTYLKNFCHPTPIAPSLPEMTVQLSAEKASTLKALAAQQYIAPEVIAYGAWALLLSRLSGQPEVVFGIQISGRSPQFHGVDRLIGHLSNTLPFRVRNIPDAMVVEWLTDLQKQWDDLQHYAHASLSQIESWSEMISSHALFESVVVFEGAQTGSAITREIAGVQVQYDSLIAPNHFPLAVMIKDCAAWELTGDAHVKELCFLLEQFAIAPQRRLAEIVLPNAPVPREIPVAMEAVRTPPPPALPLQWTRMEEEEQGWVNWLRDETCVHELFEQRAAQTPNAVAVQLQGQSLTYQELNARANQLAHYLRKLNVVPAIPVGLCFTPSLEGFISLLGVLKAGGAYLPLEATLSAENLEHIITDSGTSVLLTQSQLEPKFRTIPLHCIVLCLDSDWVIIAEEELHNPGCQVSDEHPACFLVEADMPEVITHARLAKTLGNKQEWFRFEPNNPWHLFNNYSEPGAAPVPLPFSMTIVEGRGLNELNGGLDWFDLQPHFTPPPEPEPEIPSPSFVLPPETQPDIPPISEPDFSLELDWASEGMESEAVASEFELDLPVAAPAQPEASTTQIGQDSTLAPIQQWFFARSLAEPNHYNVSLLVEIGDRLEPSALQQALQIVVSHHNALRGRFAETAQGWQWQDENDGQELPFEYVDFSAKWARSQRKAIEEMAAKCQASLHLTDGPLWRAAYFDLGDNRSPRLLVVAHQLIADEPSLRIFLHDWLTVYWQLRRGQQTVLPSQTTAYREWAQSLVASAPPADAEYWQQMQKAAVHRLPIEHREGGNCYGTADRVFVSLNSTETDNLLHRVPLAAEAEINEIVLTALTVALAQWAGEKGAWLELERDIRTALDLDMTNTMGWFATRFPVNLAMENLTDPATALRTIKTQLRAVPRHGSSYGVWRYSAANGSCDVPKPNISFKYLTFPSTETLWQPAPESVGAEHHPRNQRDVIIAVTGAMNLNMLEFRWEYAREQFEQKNLGLLVNSFIGELRHLIQYYSHQTAKSGD